MVCLQERGTVIDVGPVTVDRLPLFLRSLLLPYDILWLFWIMGWIVVRIFCLPFWRWSTMAERLGYLPPRPPCAAAVLWVHAASIGELLSARPVLALLKRRHSNLWILVSTTQHYAYELARTQIQEADRVAWLPWDFGPAIETALRRVHPDVLVLVECELWPNLIARTARQGARIALMNGRVYERDFPGYRLGRCFFAPLLQLISLLGTQSHGDTRRFLELGSAAERTFLMGNTKYDVSLPQRCRWQELRRLLPLTPGPLWVLASTHEDEEAQILVRCRPLRERFPDLQLVIAPRHIHRAKTIEATARRLHFDTVLRSQLSDPSTQVDCKRPDVILLDTVGELPLILEAADLVFIGGSLVDKGGHNPIEAGLHRKAILIGPSVFNFADIVAAFLAEEALIMVQNADDLVSRAEELLVNRPKCREMGDRAAEVIHRNTGTAQAYAKALERLLGSVASAAEK